MRISTKSGIIVDASGECVFFTTFAVMAGLCIIIAILSSIWRVPTTPKDRLQENIVIECQKLDGVSNRVECLKGIK